MKELSELKHRNDFGAWLNANGMNGLGVEIGVERGVNADRILRTSNISGMFLVDPWKTWTAEEYKDGSRLINWDEAHKATHDCLQRYPGRAIVLRMLSDDAANVLRGTSFDFVYLDGMHHNPQFSRDLVNWWPMVKRGGVFGGHDYMDRDTPEFKCEVKTLVDKFVKKQGLELHLTDDTETEGWWIQKN